MDIYKILSALNRKPFEYIQYLVNIYWVSVSMIIVSKFLLYIKENNKTFNRFLLVMSVCGVSKILVMTKTYKLIMNFKY